MIPKNHKKWLWTAFLVALFLWLVDFVLWLPQQYHDTVTVLSTIFIAFFTGTLWITSREQSQQLKRSVDLTERTFTDLERPYIFVFGVSPFLNVLGRGPGIDFTVSNFGKTPAIIQEVLMGFSLGAEPQVPTNVETTHDLLSSPIMETNDARSQRIYTDGFQFENLSPVMRDDEEFFLWVRIKYRSVFTKNIVDKSYVTSFCSRYDGITNRLIRLDDERYTYET